MAQINLKSGNLCWGAVKECKMCTFEKYYGGLSLFLLWVNLFGLHFDDFCFLEVVAPTTVLLAAGLAGRRINLGPPMSFLFFWNIINLLFQLSKPYYDIHIIAIKSYEVPPNLILTLCMQTMHLKSLKEEHVRSSHVSTLSSNFHEVNINVRGIRDSCSTMGI